MCGKAWNLLWTIPKTDEARRQWEHYYHIVDMHVTARDASSHLRTPSGTELGAGINYIARGRHQLHSWGQASTI